MGDSSQSRKPAQPTGNFNRFGESLFQVVSLGINLFQAAVLRVFFAAQLPCEGHSQFLLLLWQGEPTESHQFQELPDAVSSGLPLTEGATCRIEC